MPNIENSLSLPENNHLFKNDMSRQGHNITCHGCGTNYILPTDKAGSRATIICKRCEARIYWRVCPVCKTGYQCSTPNGACPDCPVEPETDPFYAPPPGFFSLPCPWCGGGVPILKVVLNAAGTARENAVKCPHCTRGSDVKGLSRLIPFTLVYWILAGLFIVPRLEAMSLPGRFLLATAFLAIQGLILLKTLALEKEPPANRERP